MFSDEDTDVKALVTSWLCKQKDEQYREHLRSMIDEYFYKALDIIIKIVCWSIYAFSNKIEQHYH